MEKSLTWLRIVAFAVAVGLVVFGSIENLMRTVRFGWEKAGKNNY